MAKAPFKVKSPLDVTGHVGINIDSTDNYELLVNGTKGIVVPDGTTAEAPAHKNGLIRYDTTRDTLTISRSGEWREVGTCSAGTSLPATAKQNDVFVQLQADKLTDVYAYDGSKWISLLAAVNAQLVKITSDIAEVNNKLTMDFGEY